LAKKVESFVKLETFGRVDKDLTKRLLDIIVDCYERLGPPITFSVNLKVFEASEEPGFFACHDALDGKPTINIYLDRISDVPFNVVDAGVRRQAVHSILHGSQEFYKIMFPAELRQAMAVYGLSEGFATQILYGIAMAAKEYNVTKFLVEGGYVEDQVAYAKYMLEPTDEEVKAWEIAKTNPLARIIYLVMTVRDISCAIPLLANSTFSKEIKECLKKRIGHLPESYKFTIDKIVDEMVQTFSEDTFKNINFLTKAIVECIIQKELTF